MDTNASLNAGNYVSVKSKLQYPSLTTLGHLTFFENYCSGRNPGMTHLVRRSSAMSRGTAFFSLVQTFRQCMHKCSGSPIPSLPKKLTCWFFFFFF